MTIVKSPSFVISYDNKNITNEISKYLLSLTYTDKLSGEADELEIVVDDSRGIWVNDWYPEMQARLRVDYGYIGRMVNAGTFELDETESSGPPDVMVIKSLATGVSKSLRTKNSFAHEGKTLRQIALVIAQNNGLTLQGNIEDIRIGRVTQNRETDLSFLKRIALDYGYVFSVRDSALIFSSIYDLESVAPALTIDKTDVSTHRFKDTTSKTFKSARLRHQKPMSKSLIEAKAELGTLSDGGGGTASADTLEIHARAEDELQATAKAKAHLHRHNRRGCTGTITLEGNPYLVAGITIDVTGFGVFSGTWHIVQSTHTITKDGAYTTTLEIARVKKGTKDMFAPKKK